MYIDNDTFKAYMERMMDRFDILDKKVERLTTQRNCLDGEQLLDNQDMMFLLKVSPRTLQRYRTKGILPFIKLNDGRCYYRASDVNRLILERF
ncbi:helix-turn-helix domain-containing protein [Bacteroidales bacterium OttesenSCG-928-K22]|nr:helix-turn-helix domain-containing protein [Bacteroidales bacterium OttesenSCG-928-L14]MDL2240195.1 helix-turn-helix domain-containing protein [Bacteroidales bacterium OttesenSCG-928-K22]